MKKRKKQISVNIATIGAKEMDINKVRAQKLNHRDDLNVFLNNTA